MFILYKKKTYWPFLPMLNSPLMNKKSSSFYFEPFPFILGFLVFIFLSLWFFLSFYFVISFFRLSLLLLLTLSSHFFLSLQYKTPLFSLPHVFIFLFRALHPLTPPSSYTHWMWLGPFVLLSPILTEYHDYDNGNDADDSFMFLMLFKTEVGKLSEISK